MLDKRYRRKCKSAGRSTPVVQGGTDPARVWLAVGDETGDFDSTEDQKPRGVAIVVARIPDWLDVLRGRPDGWKETVRAMFSEPLDGIREALPVIYGDEGKREKEGRTFHVKPALDYLKKSKLRGSFDPFVYQGEDRILTALMKAFRWLAVHPRLITLGVMTTGTEFHDRFPGKPDSAQVLGTLYGHLCATVLPFLNGDRLVLAAALRSEVAALDNSQGEGGSKTARVPGSKTGMDRTLCAAASQTAWDKLGQARGLFEVPRGSKRQRERFSAHVGVKAALGRLPLVGGERNYLGGSAVVLENIADLAGALTRFENESERSGFRLNLPQTPGSWRRFGIGDLL